MDRCTDSLSLADIETILDQYIALKWEFNLRNDSIRKGHVNITGGEPLLREDFPQVLRLLYERREHFGFGILTNGTLIDERMIRRLKEAGVCFVQLSLDGNRETHDCLRAPGNFDTVREKARQLEAAGIPTHISFTANASNYRQLPEVARICRQDGLTRLWTDRIVPIGHGGESDSLEITPQLMPDYLSCMKQAKGGRVQRLLHPHTEVRLNRALQFMCGGSRYRCGAGIGLIVVDENGTVMPCRRMPIDCGNFRQTTLRDIFYEHPVMEELREKAIPDECASCKERFGCFGGARCQSWAKYGDHDHGDPACPLLRGGNNECSLRKNS